MEANESAGSECHEEDARVEEAAAAPQSQPSEQDLDRAATRIQAVARGWLWRLFLEFGDEESDHPVLELTCATCATRLCRRASEAVMVSDDECKLFSTDLVTRHIEDDPSAAVRPVESCACGIVDAICRRCKAVVGYHCVEPCEPCLDSCNNGHFWLFYPKHVKAFARVRLDEDGTEHFLTWPELSGLPEDSDSDDTDACSVGDEGSTQAQSTAVSSCGGVSETGAGRHTFPIRRRSSLTFKMDPDPDLCCSICLEVMEEAVKLASCLHNFCRVCVSRHVDIHHSCPLCRAPCRFSQLEPAVEVRSVIMKLEVACRWRGKPAKDAQKTGAGCQEWITLANQTHHEAYCAHKRKRGHPSTLPLEKSSSNENGGARKVQNSQQKVETGSGGGGAASSQDDREANVPKSSVAPGDGTSRKTPRLRLEQ